ncbi:MAG: hypothetical protein GVY14_02915 [Spirochaetes bacterium]|jgi:hypothetical protein|nr:hypothetical protein [Spirochaetota bacterium]
MNGHNTEMTPESGRIEVVHVAAECYDPVMSMHTRPSFRIGVVGFLLLASITGAYAEVLRLPPVAPTLPFTADRAFLAGSQTWADYRWYTDRDETPEFGTDFELGARADLYAAPRFAVSGTVRMLYQARHLEEYTNPLAFSPRHLTTDLRLLASYRIDPVVVYGGWRHDCTHEVDGGAGRTPIHDALMAGASYDAPVLEWQHPGLSSHLRVNLEGEINVPSLFVESAAFVDRGRVTGGLHLEPVSYVQYGSLFVDGYVSLIFRETEGTNVEGIDSPAVDWAAAVGYRSPGAAGSLSVYYRIERLTDAWLDREVEPYLLSSVGVLLHMR